MTAFVDHNLPVDYYDVDAFRILVGVIESGAVGNAIRIENYDVSDHADFQHTSIWQSQPRRRQ
jgi:hypothetical protein